MAADRGDARRGEPSPNRDAGSALSTVLRGLVDYAGLFPPAALDLESSVANFLEYRRSPAVDWLGRLIIPIGRLADLGNLLRDTSDAIESALPLSVLVPQQDLDAIDGLDAARRQLEGLAEVVAVEIAPLPAGEILRLADRLPESTERYFEVPITKEETCELSAIATHGAGAKIRTGGLVAEAFPEPAELAAFLSLCRRLELRFKATAGLHHPLRGSYALTYEADSARATMNGYFNFVVAAALCHASVVDGEGLEAVLLETAAEAFRVEDDSIAWRGHSLSTEAIESARQSLFVSFGSCSFLEPSVEILEVFPR